MPRPPREPKSVRITFAEVVDAGETRTLNLKGRGLSDDQLVIARTIKANGGVKKKFEGRLRVTGRNATCTLVEQEDAGAVDTETLDPVDTDEIDVTIVSGTGEADVEESNTQGADYVSE